MPWCPKCRTEYVEGITQCADCGAPLAAEDKPYRLEDDETLSIGETGDEVFLCNVSGPVEISYITSVLEEKGIPYWMTDSDTGLYLEALMGSSFMGKDIYVGKSDYKRAADLIESFKAQPLTEEYTEDDDGE